METKIVLYKGHNNYIFYIYNYVYNLFIIIPAQAHMTIIKTTSIKTDNKELEVYNDSEHFQ